MAYDLDIVTVRVEKKPCVIVLVIVGAGPRSAVVSATSEQSSLMTRADGRTVRGGKGDVKRADIAFDVLETKKRVVSSPESSSIVTKVSNESVSER